MGLLLLGSAACPVAFGAAAAVWDVSILADPAPYAGLPTSVSGSVGGVLLGPADPVGHDVDILLDGAYATTVRTGDPWPSTFRAGVLIPTPGPHTIEAAILRGTPAESRSDPVQVVAQLADFPDGWIVGWQLTRDVTTGLDHVDVSLHVDGYVRDHNAPLDGTGVLVAGLITDQECWPTTTGAVWPLRVGVSTCPQSETTREGSALVPTGEALGWGTFSADFGPFRYATPSGTVGGCQEAVVYGGAGWVWDGEPFALVFASAKTLCAGAGAAGEASVVFVPSTGV